MGALLIFEQPCATMILHTLITKNSTLLPWQRYSNLKPHLPQWQQANYKSLKYNLYNDT